MSEFHQEQFDGGIGDSPRQAGGKTFTFSKHFDIYSDPKKLTPYKAMTANQTTAYFLTNFIYGDYGTGIGSNILAYGVVSGQATSGHPELYMKTTAADVTSGWSTVLASPGGATLNRGTLASVGSYLFADYKNYVYYASGNSNISRIGDLAVSGTAATLNQTWAAFSYLTTTQGMVWSKQEYLFFGFTTSTVSGIAKIDGSTCTTALTLPTYYQPTSICEYGNLIAIACKPRSGIGGSIVYLWDGIDTTIVIDSIPWGRGSLLVIENVDGYLVGASIQGNTIFDIKPRITIKSYAGGVPQLVKYLRSEDSTIVLYQLKDKASGQMYFAAKLTVNGITQNGIWVVGRKQGEFYVTQDQAVNNNTVPTSIEGFSKFNEYFWAGYNNDGSVNRTSNSPDVVTQSIVETDIYNGENEGNNPEDLKQLSEFYVHFPPLPASAQVIAKYRKDEETSWTIIFTETTTNSGRRSVSPPEFAFPNYRQIQFQIISTGGAEITGWGGKYDVVNDNT